MPSTDTDTRVIYLPVEAYIAFRTALPSDLSYHDFDEGLPTYHVILWARAPFCEPTRLVIALAKDD